MAFAEYLNFRIQIGAQTNGGYPVAVRGAGGDAVETLPLVRDDAAVINQAAQLTAGQGSVASHVALGSALFQALFQGRIRDAYARAQGQLDQHTGLRLIFDIAASEAGLAALPWEYLHDPEQDQPLALYDVAVVRYLPQPSAPPVVALRLPLRVLLTGAGPADETAQELAAVQAALAPLGNRVEVVVEPQLTLRTLQARLRQQFHVWHFVGRGGSSGDGSAGWLEFQGPAGVQVVQASELGILLNRSGVQLALISAGASAQFTSAALRSVAPALIRAHLPAVVALQAALPGEQGSVFAAEFYSALAEGFPIDTCVTEGRRALIREAGIEQAGWGAPVYYTRDVQARVCLSADTPQPAPLPIIDGFVGRQQELARYTGQLLANGLVAIHGISGVGKSLFAAALAAQVAAARPVCWFKFFKGYDFGKLIAALADFLHWHGRPGLYELLRGARQPAGERPTDSRLIDYLLQELVKDHYLLCLDTFPTDGKDPALQQLIERLLPLCRQGALWLVVTAREKPDFAAGSPPLGGLNQVDSQHLLQREGVTLTPKQFLTLHQTVLDGNAHLLLLSSVLLKQTDDQAALIDKFDRQLDVKTYLREEMLANLDESTEKPVVQAIAALLGYPGKRGVIEAILGEVSFDVDAALDGLQQHYMLDLRGQPDDPEYVLEPLFQDVAYNQIAIKQRAPIHRRAAAYYQADEPNPVAASRHLLHAGDHAAAAELATADVLAAVNRGDARPLSALLERFEAHQLDAQWWVRVLMARARVNRLLRLRKLAEASCQAALEAIEQLPAPATRRLQRAQIYGELGSLLRLSDRQAALEWCQRGLAILLPAGRLPDAPDERLEAALQLLTVGAIYQEEGKYQAAADALNQSVGLLPADARQPYAIAQLNLGNTFFQRGQLGQARSHYEAALPIFAQAQNAWRLVTTWLNLGRVLHTLGEWDAAARDYQRALKQAVALGNLPDQIILEQCLGDLYAKQGDQAAAIEHLLRGIELAETHQLDEYSIALESTLTDLYIWLRDWDAAEPRAQALLARATQAEAHDQLPEINRSMAQVHLARARPAAALLAAKQALDQAQALGNPRELGLSLRVFAMALLENGKPEAGLRAFAQSAAQLATQERYELARTHAQWGLALLRIGDQPGASRLIEQARKIFTKLGAQLDLDDLDAPGDTHKPK